MVPSNHGIQSPQCSSGRRRRSWFLRGIRNGLSPACAGFPKLRQGSRRLVPASRRRYLCRRMFFSNWGVPERARHSSNRGSRQAQTLRTHSGWSRRLAADCGACAFRAGRTDCRNSCSGRIWRIRGFRCRGRYCPFPSTRRWNTLLRASSNAPVANCPPISPSSDLSVPDTPARNAQELLCPDIAKTR